MDLDEAEIFGGMIFQDEDSGSAYEESSSDDGNLSQSEKIQNTKQQVTPSVRKAKSRETSTTRKASGVGDSEHRSRSSSMKGVHPSAPTSTGKHENADFDTQIAEEAKEWASSFRPAAIDNIKTPLRRAPRKRRAQKPPNDLRYKRLRPYYDNDYRELLNAEIYDATYGETIADSLEQSQIGSSNWTAVEKDLLFSSLPRHGIDNVREIANYIGTKSEPEVREFLSLLQTNVEGRKRKGRRDFMDADLPAALEISEECCLVLERAGEALAVRQEMAEEKVEKSKWSEMWLIDEQVAGLIERRRRAEGGEEALDAVLPAGNLFISRNWLELSRRVFMNPGEPRAEDNWETLAEPGEAPAIRATAFEDFHSLAVNIVKKLISTTLFCTMSRLRSGNYHYVKVSEVTPDDVEAANSILGLKSNSEQFWVSCAKRNNLEVIDDGEDAEQNEGVALTTEDVEEDLRSVRRSRSRSRSRSLSHQQSRASSQFSVHDDEEAYSSPSEVDVGDDQDFHSESSLSDDEEPLVQDDSPDFTDPESPSLVPTNKTTKIQDRKAAERAQDTYAETIDMQASHREEARLWDLIEQEPPFEIETGSAEPAQPLAIRGDLEDGRSWRRNLDYWSPWETMSTPVLDSAFKRNMERKSRRAKARAKGSWPLPGDRIGRYPALDEDLETLDEGDDGHSLDLEDENVLSEIELRSKLENETIRETSHDHHSVASDNSIAVRYPGDSSGEEYYSV